MKKEIPSSWYYALFWIDPGEEIGLCLNGGTPQTEALSAGQCADPLGNTVYIGVPPSTFGEVGPYLGIFDEIAVFDEMLDGGQRAELWNSGVGIFWSCPYGLWAPCGWVPSSSSSSSSSSFLPSSSSYYMSSFAMMARGESGAFVTPELLALAAAEAPGAVIAQYVWGARPGHRDELILRDRDAAEGGSRVLNERLYCLMDYFDPVAVADVAGEVVERYGFSAFGLREVMAPDWTHREETLYDWNFAFHGQFLDFETGYYNYGYRYYIPWLGRWPNRDPIGERGGRNLYGYGGNNGSRYIDKFGLEFDDGGGLREVPLADVTNSAHGWLGATGSQDPDAQFYKPTSVGMTETRIVVESARRCCVELVSVQHFDVRITATIANDQIGIVWTQAGFNAASTHELSRIDVYRRAYNTYLAPFEEGGIIQTRCRPCRTSESTAASTASRLKDWVSKQREKAEKMYIAWVREQQGLITGENRRLDREDNLISGIRDPHTVEDPPEIMWDPCPNL